jgi:DNA invertase Pin-like site-specific DNA recombinase
MANLSIGMEVQQQIKLLNELGIGKKKIAQQLGISRNTVKSYLNKGSCIEQDAEVVVDRVKALYSFFVSLR